MKNCTICGNQISAQNEKRNNTICRGCKTSKKFLKNGLKTRQSRIPIAIDHLNKIGIEKASNLNPYRTTESSN